MKDNYLFLKEVKNLVEKTNCELKVCFQYINRGDRWIQVRSGAGEGVAQGSGEKSWLNVNILAPRVGMPPSARTCTRAQRHKYIRKYTADTCPFTGGTHRMGQPSCGGLYSNCKYRMGSKSRGFLQADVYRSCRWCIKRGW